MVKIIQLDEDEFINLGNINRVYISDGRLAIIFNGAREPYFIDDSINKEKFLRFLCREAYHID